MTRSRILKISAAIAGTLAAGAAIATAIVFSSRPQQTKEIEEGPMRTLAKYCE